MTASTSRTRSRTRALDADEPPYYRPPPGSPAHEYLSARRMVLAGPVPQRLVRPIHSALPDAKVFTDLHAGSGTQAASTTMAFARPTPRTSLRRDR